MREREMLVSAVTVAYASVIFFVMWELSSLQTNLFVTRFAAVRAIEEGSQSVLRHSLQTMENDLSLKPSEPSLLKFTLDVIYGTITMTAKNIPRDIVVQLYTGFFPSNIIQTAQALFEYNFVPTASAISSITVGLSQSYYNQYKKVFRTTHTFSTWNDEDLSL